MDVESLGSTAEAKPSKTPLTHLKTLAFLKDLVCIDSCTRNIAGVNAAQQYMAEHLLQMGLTPSRIKHPKSEFADLLVARLNVGAPQTISLLMHADTVIENSSSFQFRWTDQKTQIVGPGIADDKGGIAVALSGLQQFLQLNPTLSFNLQLVSSPNEELGSEGFTPRLNHLGQHSAMVLGFEPALSNGNIISSRHGNRWYDIEIRGREAHSGRANGEEINAAHELAHKIVKLSGIRDQVQGSKVNIGAIRSARDNYNIVCGRLKAKLDVRFTSLRDRDLIHELVENILSSSHIFAKDGRASEASYELADDCPPLEPHAASLEAANIYSRLLSQIEDTYNTHEHASGASDVNHMTHATCISLDGLGPVGGKLHTSKEYIWADSLHTRSEALAQFLFYVNEKQQLNLSSLNGGSRI